MCQITFINPVQFQHGFMMESRLWTVIYDNWVGECVGTVDEVKLEYTSSSGEKYR